jgi:hypothetical protein
LATIRTTLEATNAQLLAVLRQFVRPVSIGMAGVAIAVVASRLLRVALYGLSNLDPTSYASGRWKTD